MIRVEKPLPSMKEEGSSPSTRSSSSIASDRHSISEAHDLYDEEPLTDADGWVYGDNKWEGQGPRGGIGKYTRYRRWTRVAVVQEIVQTVGDGEVGIQQHNRTYSMWQPTLSEEEGAMSKRKDRNDSPLRQRLKALTKTSLNSSA